MSWFRVKKQQLLGDMFLSWWKKKPQGSWQKLISPLLGSACKWHILTSAHVILVKTYYGQSRSQWSRKNAVPIVSLREGRITDKIYRHSVKVLVTQSCLTL